MSGGPFRDTLTPLLDEARVQLGELRTLRASLEARYLEARARLEDKMRPRRARLVLLSRGADPPAPPGAWRVAFIAGLVGGLVIWPLVHR